MARIPSTSINRSWNILKRSFLHGHPHEVWEYYIACYYTTAIVQSFRSLADNALETSWRHRINPKWTQKTRQESAMIAAAALRSRCVNAAKWKTTRSNAVDAQRERDREAVKIQKTSERYLCKRNRLVTSSILRLYALLERVNGALVALSETS